jgi:hypothetical protein
MSDRSMRPEDPLALRRTIAALEAEVDVLRRRLHDAPHRVNELENRLSETSQRLQKGRAERTPRTRCSRRPASSWRPPGRGREADHPAQQLRHRARRQRRRHRRRRDRQPQAAGGAQPTIEVKQLIEGPGGAPQRVLHHRRRPHLRCDRRGRQGPGQDADGRLVVIARADDELVVTVAESMKDMCSSASATTSGWTPAAPRLEKLARPEVEELVLEEVPDITYEQVGGLDRARSSRSATPSNCPTSTRTCSATTGWRLRRGSSSTGRPDAARPSSPRPWPTASPRRWPNAPAAPTPARTSSTSKAPSCSTSGWARPSARSG